MNTNEKSKVLKRKELLCKFKNSIDERRKKVLAFRKLTDSFLQDNIKFLQQICWYKNRRRLEHAKPSKIPKQDPKSLVNCYNRLVQFRSQPVEMIWLELVRLVSLMLGVYGAMQKRGCMLERLTYRNIMDQYRTAVNITDLGIDSNAMNVNYNYKDYAATKKISVPAEAVKIMLKNENLRTQEDIMAIYWLMMDLPVFQNNYSHELRMALAKNLKYFKCESKRVLTARNRNPIRVYFIFSGIVSVVVDSEDSIGSIKKTISLGRGSCIGHTLKSSHCVCLTDCEFLTTDKSVYMREKIHEVEKKKLEERFHFFRNWPPLEDWSDNAIYDIASLSYTDHYPSGTLILQDKFDEELDLIWFILRGKIDVVKVANIEEFKKTIEKKNNNLEEVKQKFSKFLEPSVKTTIQNKNLLKGKCKENIIDTELATQESFYKLPRDFLDKKHSVVSYVEIQNKPIYLRMRTLCQGECYGLDNIADEKLKLSLPDDRKSTKRFCLVSRDSLVIRLSCSHFKGLTQVLGINKNLLVKAMHSYYDDEKIYNTMKTELEWMKYKKYNIESLVLRKPTKIKAHNFVNHLKHTSNNTSIAAFNQPNYMNPVWKVVGYLHES